MKKISDAGLLAQWLGRQRWRGRRAASASRRRGWTNLRLGQAIRGDAPTTALEHELPTLLAEELGPDDGTLARTAARSA